MAEQATNGDTSGPPTFSEKDMAHARQWFKKGADLRDRQNYDYAIESYLRGLEYWPEAVEEGHMPLRSLAVQRAQVGGKKPGMMDNMKRSMSGKDPKVGMLNAEYLLAKDPNNAGYAEGLVKNAGKGGFLLTCEWAGPIALDILKKEKKPNKGRFAALREALVEAAEKADEWGDNSLETRLLQIAVNSLDYIVARMPTDDSLRDEMKNLAGRLTISRGKYDSEEGDFRDSLQDADKQKLLHDAERAKQGEQTLESLIAAARQEYEEQPDSSGALNRYISLLRKTETEKYENEAIEVLMKEFGRTKNYNFKARADELRLAQLRRRANALAAKAKRSGADEDRQQARLAAMEYRQEGVQVYREQVKKYPTDLKLKYQLGRSLFELQEYDESIPLLQAAQQDPRYRSACQLLLGRAFFEQDAPGQAVEVLREALEKYEGTDDRSKQLQYWLSRSLEAENRIDEALDAYGKLLREDYNFMDGEARRRTEELRKRKKQAQ